MNSASKTGRGVPKSRPPLQRMMRIHQALQSGRFPNAETLAEQLEVSTKTVHRDLEFMRDRLELPIDYNGSRFGYHYTEDVGAFPNVQITEGELFALVVAEKALQQYRGTSFEQPLLSAIRKMQSALPETISLNLQDIDQTISFRTRAAPVLNLQIFETLAKATTEHAQLRITYRKPGQQKTEERIVDPYHLANLDGEWYLFAYDHLRRDLRTFVPARMKKVERTGIRFSRSQKFSLEKRLRDSFGVRSGDAVVEVVIRFSASIADYVREKKWHESQRLVELRHGGVELRMKLSGLSEVQRWVLGWGGDAVVVKPSELAAGVAQAAKKLLNPKRTGLL